MFEFFVHLRTGNWKNRAINKIKAKTLDEAFDNVMKEIETGSYIQVLAPVNEEYMGPSVKSGYK